MTTISSKNRRFNPLMALLALAPIAVIAQSQAAGTEAHTSTVTLADLDLSTPEGVNIARDRLHAAARQLCSQVAGPSPSNPTNFIACLNDTVTDALRQIDQPGRAAIESGAWNILPSGATSDRLPPSAIQSDVRVISVANFDLSTPDGVRMAKDRIKKTARHICGQLAAEDTGLSSDYARCVDDTTLAALRQVPSPAMAAMRDAPKPHIEITARVASK